jgi:hypothetical protein
MSGGGMDMNQAMAALGAMAAQQRPTGVDAQPEKPLTDEEKAAKRTRLVGGSPVAVPGAPSWRRAIPPHR